MRDQPQDLRGLKALVAGLGVLVVIGTVIVVGTIIHRIYASYTATSIPAPLAPPAMPLPAAMPAPTSPTAAGLAAGEHIAGIAAAGPEVAVWVSGPAGDRLLLLDPVSGRLRVVLAPAMTEPPAK